MPRPSACIFGVRRVARHCAIGKGGQAGPAAADRRAREKAGSAIWLDLALKSGATPLEGEKFQAGDAELEFRPCPASEANSVGKDSSGEGPDGENPAA